MREWLSPRALGWPARTAAGRVLALRGLLFVASACALDGMARLAAWRLHKAGVTAIGWLEDAGAVLFLIVVLRLASTFGFRPDRMRSRRWRQTLPWWRRPLSGPKVLLCGILLLPMMLEHHVNPFEGWESAYTRTIDPYMHVMRLWLYAYMLHQASSRGWRLRRIQWTKLPSTKAGTTVS